jgi:hypothetical protein
MNQPSRLLDARSQVVPFTGRETELRRLREWLDSTDARLSVLLLHAPGGQGKTRLAAEFAERSRDQDLAAAQRWHVLQGGFRSTPTNSSSDRAVLADGDEAGVLLIVDYADRWAHSELERLLADPVLHQQRLTRVLMIGRTVRWYGAIRGELADRRAAAEDLLLAPLDADRFSMFAAARDRYVEPDLYDLPDATSIQPPGSLDHRDFGLTLTLHMAALVAVDACKRGERPPSDPHELSAYLLDREYRAWQRLFDAASQGQDYKTRPAIMARAVFTATLTGAVSHDIGTRALQALDLPGHPQDLLLDHRFCYPPTSRELVLEPLYPDRLAEDFLGLIIPGHDITAYDPDPWASTVPAALLTIDGIRQTIAARAVTFLASTASRWPHVGEKVLYPLLRTDPGLAIDAGGTALTALADINDIPGDVLRSIERLLPEGPHVDLDVGAAAVTGRFVTPILDILTQPSVAPYNPRNTAILHHVYSRRLAFAGRHDEALDHSQQALQLWTTLAASNRAAHLPHLAEALNNHASRLVQAGRRDEAPAYSQRAVEYYGELAATNPTAHLPNLAVSVGNHAIRLAEAGRGTEALDHSLRAIHLREELVRVNQTVYLPDLAGALTSYAAMLAEAGRGQEALAYSQRAVDYFGELAEANRAVHLPGLAAAVTNYADQLAQAGRRDDALAYSQRAIGLQEELAAANRAAYLPGLAMAMNNHALALAEAGRRSEALSRSELAVDYYSELAEANPAVHLPGLAGSVGNHVDQLAQAGRRDEALAYSQRAIGLLEELAAVSSAVHLPGLARAVGKHALMLAQVGREQEALAYSQRAVDCFGELAAANRAVHLPNLAVSVGNHALRLAEAGRRDEALAYSELAVEYDSELAAANRAAHLPGLAISIGNHVMRLAEAGQKARALEHSQRAVEHWRELAAVDPAAHLPGLARSWWYFASLRATLGMELVEAGKAALLAVRLYRELDAVEPGVFTRDLHAATGTMAQVLNALDSADEAEQASRAQGGE